MAHAQLGTGRGVSWQPAQLSHGVSGASLLRPALPRPARRSACAVRAGPRPLHTVFTVEKATPELKKELGVDKWGVWGTEGTARYKTGIKSPLKVYDCNELSYIISGSMEITPEATGVPVLVQAGDFVTFPNGFACYWFVKEAVTKNYYLY